MFRNSRLPIGALAGWLAVVSWAPAQTGPYIGYVYPAGGQQGTTFPVKLGGQRLDDVDQVLITGSGVSARIVEYFRPMGAQETSLLREQLTELRRGSRPGRTEQPAAKQDRQTQRVLANIDRRMAEYCNRPASVSIAGLVFLEVTIAADAEPGRRELRLATSRGITNPLVFQVGQLPEFARTPMRTSDLQVLGKEEQALRRRPPEEVEQQITLPCTVNGQIASGEVNWYRFTARRGQRLVLTAAARDLIPYIADAVPGWFQPVLTVYDAGGKELAYNDDYHFRPDPTLLFEVPEDGEYRFTINDALYRGREDFVYRVTVGELPFVTSIFPLGGEVGEPVDLQVRGWNLDTAELAPPPAGAGAGIHWLAAVREGFLSNRVPFALGTLPECFEQEVNDDPATAQPVQLPIVVNGRVDRAGDWDVFRIQGQAGETIVAEVSARRLDSPLDSLLKVTDRAGNVLAVNDDYLEAGTGLNTHQADSYVMFQLPEDGNCYVHLGDTAHCGGDEYAYRLRISPPQPGFELRVVPSAVVLRPRTRATLNVYALGKDGFQGDIRLALKDPPAGFSSTPARLTLAPAPVPDPSEIPAHAVGRLVVQTSRRATEQPVRLTVEGQAVSGATEIVREAVPAEDRMQAFLWRHLVTAEDLPVSVGNLGGGRAAAARPEPSPEAIARAAASAGQASPTAQFTQQQVAGRLRQLRLLYQEWLLTEDFYARKVAECEAAR